MAVGPIPALCRCDSHRRLVPLQQDGTVDDNPTLLQKIKHEGSVLSLAVSDEYIFAGTQRNNILVAVVKVLC